jgi:hypothetical protein
LGAVSGGSSKVKLADPAAPVVSPAVTLTL